jgi:heme exporter protein C
MKRIRILLALAAAGVAVGTYYALTAPPDALQGAYARIMSVHVPSLWLAFLAFFVTSFGSIAWLVSKRPRWDRLAASSVEIGVLFTGIGILTGMIWGKAVWGIAWDWGDWRLATTAIMFFVYVGYLALRGATDDPVTRANRSAILGVIAVVQVPLVYFSVNLFRTLHQSQSIRPGGSTLPDEMRIALLVNVAAFTLIYIALLAARIHLAKELEAEGGRRILAGEAVDAPRVDEVGDV